MNGDDIVIRECYMGSLENIGFVSICARYKGKWVLCFHKHRQKWEGPGGHVEENEGPLAAAKRELFEETGAIDFDIVPAWDYQALNDDGTLHNNGRWYYVTVREFTQLPEGSEMDCIDFFNELPENFTYDRKKIIKCFNRTEKYASAFYF